MSVLPPEPAEPVAEDPLGARYPNTARVWNYHLRGKDNFAVDQRAAEAVNAKLLEIGVPSAADTAVETRHLLQRTVDFMVSQGVRQFLDLGSGLPSMANTHQIVHRADPGARVVYVDIDPMVSTHATALMAGSNVVTLQADLRQPEQVIFNPAVRELLDFGQPIGLLFICVLHCLWDSEDPWGVVRQFRDAVVPGSYLTLSQMTDEAHPQAAQAILQMTQDLRWNTPLVSRSRADIARFFDGFTLVEPGLVTPAQWRPELDNPLRNESGEAVGEPVLGVAVPKPPQDERGAAWNLCGVGVKQ
jgi:hypothetical protein